MNSLRESCKALLVEFYGDGVQLAIAWQAVSNAHPDWETALNCDSLPVLRSETLAFNRYGSIPRPLGRSWYSSPNGRY
ncbi:MAG TPA: hypothetical protein V6C78_29410 [Crinalium sp.]|jgi:hypothetical protein